MKNLKQKLQNNIDKINSLNSRELLEYSKLLREKRQEIGKEVSNYLFNAVHERTKVINSGLDDKKKCELKEMIKKFIKNKKD